MSTWNGRSIITPAPDLTITTKQAAGGSVSRGVHKGNLDPGGIQFPSHKCLELKAACFAVRAFTVNQRHLHVHLRIDNRTAVAYLLKMGGNAIPFIARDSPGTVGLCLKQADNSDCRISA